MCIALVGLDVRDMFLRRIAWSGLGVRGLVGSDIVCGEGIIRLVS